MIRLNRRKSTNARTKKRRKTEFARVYGSKERVAAIKTLVCYACLKRPSENAHLNGEGMGRKSGWRNIVNLCSHCHRTGKDSLHNCGSVDEFERRHPNVDLRARAAFLAELLPAEMPDV